MAPDYYRIVRSPSRKRPNPRRIAPNLDPNVLAACAERVRYDGSPEHKSYPSFAGAPRLRSDATRCPQHLKDQTSLTLWLQDSIRRGLVSDDPADGEFPRYVWVHREDTWFEARLINRDQGTYKGYPLLDDEVPLELAGRSNDA